MGNFRKHFWTTAVFAVLAGCAPQAKDAPDNASSLAYNTAPSALLAQTLPELSKALRSGEISAEHLVQAYLERIAHIDTAGPSLQSILTLNPDALEQARVLDALRAAGEPLGALHGIPILLKDNIESKDNMPTTAGSFALKDNVTRRDSPSVAGLRAAGAIILGKTNLSQWANFRSNNSMSGWSALGGQVRNPHILDRNTCGSSAGSGAAMAASLAAGTVGTETNGSIICPSTVNGIVGFKPSTGLVSQDYIVPVAPSQDTAGPMTKTVKGAAMMLGAMASGDAKTDYLSELSKDALKGTRVGVLRFAQGRTANIQARFNQAIADMEDAGAILVEIEDYNAKDENFGSNSFLVLKYEFKEALNRYLADTPAAVKTRSLDQLIAFNEKHADVELTLFDQSIFEATTKLGGLDSTEYKAAIANIQLATGKNGIDALLAKHNVKVLVAPSGPVPGRVDPINGDVWPSWAGAGNLAAVSGYPHLSVPMGDIHGLPIGVSFMAAKNQDAQVLAYGYAYEQHTQHRIEPQYLTTSEDRPELKKAMAKK